MESEVKTISSAFILIRAIKTCKHIVPIDKMDAIEDITRMLVNTDYANLVNYKNYVVKPETTILKLLVNLFDNTKSELGEVFYTVLQIQLGRENLKIESIETKNKEPKIKSTVLGELQLSYSKPIERARRLIDSINKCMYITDKDKSNAIADITRMLNDRKYAKSVDFGVPEFVGNDIGLLLVSLFDFEKTELGRNFYWAITQNLRRSE